jgi:peptidoglycan/xylan/chitin deacetylase (PgdA/CDA1 family)
MYHYIKSFNKALPYFNFLHLDDFKKQINYLEKKNLFFKIGDDLHKNYNKNKILLTFDDGLKEHLKIAKYLKKKNILGVFFIPGLQLKNFDFLPIHKIHLIFGKHNSFDLLKIFEKFKININFNKNIYTTFKKQKNFLDKKNLISENNKKIFLKTLLNNLDQKNSKFVKNIFNHCFTEKKKKKIFKNFYMNKKDIMVLDKLGMRIGGHGYGHKVLSKLTYNQQIIDISKSLNLLSNIIKKKIDIFCYPYGGFEVFNKDTIKILNKKKIIYSFNVDSKDWTLKSNKLYVPRYDCNEFKYGKIFKLN